MFGTSLPSTAMIPEGITFPNPTCTSDSASYNAYTRRTSKACANCRRDKIRCDGGRPCGNCIKKRFHCTDGCQHCRKARVRCEDGRPCRRCREKDLECQDEPEPPPKPVFPVLDATGPLSVYPAGLSAPKIGSSARNHSVKVPERVKLACLACRKDNKKCDDERPCSRCVARGQDCIHVEKGPKQVKSRCEACRRDSRKCEDTRPCRHCAYQGIECVDAPRKGRGHGLRTRAACNSCRRDKIRCDGGRPCSTCVRKGLHCIDQPCTECVREGKSARACTHATPPEPGIPYEAPSTSLQADQYQDPSASYQNIDPSLQLHHSVGVAGVQHTPEVHVPHYPVQTSYQQHIPNIPPFPMHPQSHPGMMQHAEAYASLPSTSHSMMDFPMPQNQGGHYSNFSVMESDYAAQDFQGRMVSAERFG